MRPSTRPRRVTTLGESADTIATRHDSRRGYTRPHKRLVANAKSTRRERIERRDRADCSPTDARDRATAPARR